MSPRKRQPEMDLDVAIKNRRLLAEARLRANQAIRVLAQLDPEDPLLVALLECYTRPASWQELQSRLRPVGPGISPIESSIYFWQNYAATLETRAAELKEIKRLEAFKKLQEEQPSEEAQRPT